MLSILVCECFDVGEVVLMMEGAKYTTVKNFYNSPMISAAYICLRNIYDKDDDMIALIRRG